MTNEPRALLTEREREILEADSANELDITDGSYRVARSKIKGKLERAREDLEYTYKHSPELLPDWANNLLQL